MYKHYGKPGKEYLTNSGLKRNGMIDPLSFFANCFSQRKSYIINN